LSSRRGVPSPNRCVPRADTAPSGGAQSPGKLVIFGRYRVNQVARCLTMRGP
jgi:hypothetical protein